MQFALVSRVAPLGDLSEQALPELARVFEADLARATERDAPDAAAHELFQDEGLGPARGNAHREPLELAVPIERLPCRGQRQILDRALGQMHGSGACRRIVEGVPKGGSGSF